MSAVEGTDTVVPAPGAHGGDAEALAAALGVEPANILDLSASLNPLAPDVAALVRSHAEAIHRYPDPLSATAALAEAIGIDADRLLLTNGGAQAIALVAADLGAARVVEPEFSLWRRHLVAIRPAGQAGDAERVRSNPNNPVGTLAGGDEVAACWDEAFFALATGRWTRGDTERGSIVVGSLTKLFACPGLRIGYVLGPDPDLIERLRGRQAMWSVNSLALDVLPMLLGMARLPCWAREIAALRDSLRSLFETAGFVVDAADAPWVLVRRAGWLRAGLGRSGVLVRDCTSFGLEDVIRVAVPRPEGLRRLEVALDRAMADHR